MGLLSWFRSLFHKPKPQLSETGEARASSLGKVQADKFLVQALGQAREGVPSKPHMPLSDLPTCHSNPNPTSSLEEIMRKSYLPEPTTKRITRSTSPIPPAERHRHAIERSMKGHGRFAPHYRRSIKQSPHIKIEEED